MLSFLTWRSWNAEVKGLNAVPQGRLAATTFRCSITPTTSWSGWGRSSSPSSLLAAFLLWRGKLYNARWMLWILLLLSPFPYIANTAGWMTAELGRQPWLVYGLLRTVDGYSKMVSAGNGWFSFLGFLGMYTVLSDPVPLPGAPRDRARAGAGCTVAGKPKLLR